MNATKLRGSVNDSRNPFPSILLLLGLLFSFGCIAEPPSSPVTVQTQTKPKTLGSDAANPNDHHETAHTRGFVATDRMLRKVSFEKLPERIISLTPASTELMFAIGAGEKLVGVTKNCNYPEAAQSIKRVGGGTLESLSREVIVSLRPDLVLCKWDNHQPLMDALHTLHIPTLAIGPETMEEMFQEAEMLGMVTGHTEQAHELVGSIRRQLTELDTLVSKIPVEKRKRAFYEVWDDPLMTAGPESFIGEALRRAGLINIFGDVKERYPKVSNEVTVARNPEVILSPSTHASRVSLEQMLNRPGWQNVAAIKNRQVFIVDGDPISRCGPRLIDAIEEIHALAYGDKDPAAAETVRASALEGEQP